MTRTARVALVVAGVVVMVAAFVALRPSSQDDDADRSVTPQSETAGTSGVEPEASGRPIEPEASGRPRKPRKERPVLLRAGDPQTVKTRKGERVRFTARSERADEVHVHGYDITRRTPAGRTVSVSFVADIEGIFEIELHVSGEEIGELEVRP